MNRTNHQLSLEPVADGSWRLRDRDVPESDAQSLVAYIERRDGRYEMTWIHDEVDDGSYDSLGELLAAAASALTAEVSRRAERTRFR